MYTCFKSTSFSNLLIEIQCVFSIRLIKEQLSHLKKLMVFEPLEESRLMEVTQRMAEHRESS